MRQRGLLLAQHLDQPAQVGLFKIRPLRALLEPGHLEQLGDQVPHAPRLPLDHVDRLGILRRVLRMAARVLALGEDDRDRCAQLVRRIRGELLFGFKRGLQPGEHIVKRLPQPADLVPSGRQTDAAGQVAPPR